MQIIFVKHVSNFLERMMFMCFHKMAKFIIMFIFPFKICFLCTFFWISHLEILGITNSLLIVKLSQITTLLMFGKIVSIGGTSSIFMFTIS